MARIKHKKAIKSKSRTVKASTDQAETPTPELQARVQFELGQVINETGQRIGLAYRRKPLLETMALSGSFSPDEVSAMRFYRTAFDRTERSPVRSCLNVGAGRGSESPAKILSITPSMIDAKRKVQQCEQFLGPTLHTMRGVLLYDQSFRELAMLRYGSRLTITANGKTRVSPRSGRHKGYIKDEFLRGLEILTDAIRHMVSNGATEELWVDPLSDGSAIIRRGLVAPAGRYRCWGDEVLIDKVTEMLRSEFGNGLKFASAIEAINGLKMIKLARFKMLNEDDLAA